MFQFCHIFISILDYVWKGVGVEKWWIVNKIYHCLM